MLQDLNILTPKGRKTYFSILEAAAKCVAELGIENTSVTVIAQKANTSRSLVAHYLPRQEDLLLAIMDHIGRVGTEMVTPRSDSLKGDEKLLFSVRSNFSFFDKFPHYYSCQLLLYNSSAIRGDCKKLNRFLYNAFISRMVGFLKTAAEEKGVDIEEGDLRRFAEQIYSNLDGALVVYFFMLAPSERPEYLKHFMNRIEKEVQFFFFFKKFLK